MLFLANHRRLVLTLVSSVVLLALFLHSTSSSDSSILTSLKEGKDALSFDFDWSSSTSSTSADEGEEEGGEVLPVKVEGQRAIKSPLYREFEGRPFVPLNQRKPFAEVAVLGDECLELCEYAFVYHLPIFLSRT